MTAIPSAEAVRNLCARLGFTAARPLTEHEKNAITQHKPNGIQATRKGKPGPKAKGTP